MPDELEERLRSHTQAFDSLLSLIPAKLYYGEDVSDQWKRKKQTPEQKRAAKMAKLDPDNWKSAKDIMDERQAAILKRKREDERELSDPPVVEPEKPKADQDHVKPKAKKRKTADSSTQLATDQDTKEKIPETEEERIQRRKEQKAARKERKKERKAKAKEKLDRQKARKQEAKQQQQQQHENQSGDTSVSHSKSQAVSSSKDEQPPSDEEDNEAEDAAEVIDIDEEDAFTKGTPISDDGSISRASDHEVDAVFSPPHDSGTSSISSIPPPSTESPPKTQQQTSSSVDSLRSTDQTTNSRQPSLQSKENLESSTSSQDPKQRLQAAISAFRAERKADDGPKSRAELLEQRRRQEERRRAEKKEQKRREKEEAARKQEEEITKRFSPGGSGSLLGSPRSPLIDTDINNFSFGRVAFGDGSTFDPANSSATEPHKKKGPSDPATALKAAQMKQQRVSGLDAEKRATIQEKDRWMNARKRAAGEKVKDDTSLLKKALKRHEGQKKKSEKEWNERKEGVWKSMDMKQKKRTENLAKRKEEKNYKGKKVKRPGFEGSFRGRTGGGKKKA